MKRGVALAGLVLLMFCGICIIENAAVRARPPEPVDRGNSSMYMLAGEFRTVFANLLWIKVDQYHHEFTEHNRNWTQNKELIGLLNLITSLDPHFQEAYAVGSAIYSEGFKDNQKAMSYLLEGIHNNPRAWELHKIAVIMYARHLHNPKRALFHARLMVKYCDDQWYLPSLQRLANTVRRLAEEQKGNADCRLQNAE